MDGLNYGTYYFFRSMAKETPDLHGVIRGIDLLGTLAVTGGVALVLVALLLWQGRMRAALVTVGLMLSGFGVLEGLNRAIGTPRPEERDEAYAGVDLGPAFASRAAFLSALVYGLVPFVIGAKLRGVRWILLFSGCILLVLAVGFSQLYLRIDYLTGILAGWTWAAFLLLLWQQLPASASNRAAPG
jgi:membrane-associated phospholipid phosphatase